MDLNSMRAIDIQEFRNILLDTLKYIDMVCRKEGIKYFAAYGTLLGAVRHKGFIPWDDDADVCMMRSEYEKFCEAVKKYPDPRFFWQTTTTNRGYWLPFLGRLCRNDTIRWPSNGNVQYHEGIYVDVYPIDYAFPTMEQTRRHFRATRYLHHNIMYRRLRSLRGTHNIESVLFTALCKLPPIEFYNWLYRRIIHNPNPDKSMLFDFSGSFNFERYYWPSRIFDETIELPFEDMMVPFPKNLDALLTKMYGDYMTPPPVERRKTHYPYELDFGPFADIPIPEKGTNA